MVFMVYKLWTGSNEMFLTVKDELIFNYLRNVEQYKQVRYKKRFIFLFTATISSMKWRKHTKKAELKKWKETEFPGTAWHII